MPPPTGFGSGNETLTKDEKNGISKKLGNMASALQLTVAKVYVCAPNGSSWTDTGAWGALALVIDRTPPKCNLIKVFDLKTFEVKFCQELYANMNYEALDANFHSFEADNAIIGLSIPDANEANAFLDKVRSNIPAGTQAPVTTENAAASQKGVKKFMTLALDKAKSTLMKEPTARIISTPTNFVHRQHIGYDPAKGFECSEIPEQWKAMFKNAGIKKKDLQNPETAKLIYETLQNELGGMEEPAASPGPPSGSPPPGPPGPPGVPSRSAPPVPSRAPGGGAPPAAPPMAAGPPPPPAPPMMIPNLAPPSDGPAPPSRSSSGNPPASPTSGGGSGSGGAAPRGDLLSAIRGGATLRKVEPGAAGVALPTQLDNAQQNNLTSMLQKAMGDRFKVLAATDHHDDDPEEDWD